MESVSWSQQRLTAEVILVHVESHCIDTGGDLQDVKNFRARLSLLFDAMIHPNDPPGSVHDCFLSRCDQTCKEKGHCQSE